MEKFIEFSPDALDDLGDDDDEEQPLVTVIGKEE